MSLAELQGIIESMPVSSAQFRVDIRPGWNGDKILSFDRIGERTFQMDENNPLSCLAYSNFREHFDNTEKKFKVDVSFMLNCCGREIRQNMLHFMDNTSHTFSENHDNMFKWYSNYAFDRGGAAINDNIIGIWKYLCINGAMLCKKGKEPHFKNGYALLELIFQKNFKEEHLPKRHK